MWLALAVVAAALSAGLLVGGPARPIGRLRVRERALPALPSWLEAVPGAPSLRRRTIMAALAAGAIAVALGSLGQVSTITAVAVAVGLTGLGTVALGRLESEASRQATAVLQADLPQAWELLAAGLVAGLPLRSALAEVVEVVDGQLAVLLGEVLTRMRLGEPDDVAWRTLADHRLMGQASRDLARSVASGTSVAELLDEYAVQAREDRQAAAEAKAKAIGVRAVLPLMLCFLPAFFLIGIVPIVAGALLPLISRW